MDNLKVMAAVIILQLYIEHYVVNLLIAEIVLIIMKQLSLCIRVCAVIAVLKCSKGADEVAKVVNFSAWHIT